MWTMYCGLTPSTGVHLVETHSCHTLQSGAIQLDGSATTTGETTPEGQALEVWAVLNDVCVSFIDDQLADVWEYGAFAFERRPNGSPAVDIQQLQPSKVWQPMQGLDEILHEVFGGIFKV